MRINIGPYPENYDDERVEEVAIDDYDVWSMDSTLAMIITPMLKVLKKNKQGGPCVDSEDVPEELRMSDADVELYKKEGSTDEKFHDRWDYVIDEMIWAFEQILDDDSDSQFHTGVRDIWHQPLDKDRNKIGEPIKMFEEHEEIEGVEMYEMIKGPNDTSHFDNEGYIKHHERILKGTTYFGKYYRALWD